MREEAYRISVLRPRTQFVYTGIRVRNLDRSIAFYKMLGFRIRWRGQMEHGGEWVRMAQLRSKREIELNYYPPGNRYYSPLGRAPEFDHFGAWVSDFGYWYRKLRKAGARVQVSPFNDWSSTFGTTSRLAFVLDPDGFPIEIWSTLARRRRSGPKSSRPSRSRNPPRRRR